VGFKRKKS
jgi:hypothetical protein